MNKPFSILYRTLIAALILLAGTSCKEELDVRPGAEGARELSS